MLVICPIGLACTERYPTWGDGEVTIDNGRAVGIEGSLLLARRSLNKHAIYSLLVFQCWLSPACEAVSFTGDKDFCLPG